MKYISKIAYVKLGDKDVGDATDDCDEVKHVPRVLEIVLHVDQQQHN